MTKTYQIEPFDPPGDTAEEIQSKGPGQIQGRDSLDWALRKLAEARLEVAEIDKQAAAAHDAIDNRRAVLVERIDKEAVWFEGLISVYASSHRGELITGKRKTADSLHGSISYRKKGGKLVIEDKDALRAWLEQQPVELGLSRVVLEPDKKALDAHFEATNTLPPGCRYEPETESISIEAIAPEMALKGTK